MSTPETHLFICTNGPDRDGKCGSKGAESLRQVVKSQLASNFTPQQVRVNASGCLGQCEKGIACVVYPHQQWHFNVKPDDAGILIESVKKLLE